jgi:16S rRNA (cytosine967-C5)-methyltransferase
LGLRPQARRGDRPQRARPQRKKPPGLAVRRTAASILRQVIERGVPLDALTDEGRGTAHFRALSPRDRALTRAILTTALRHHGEIEAALARCLDQRLPDDAGGLASILRVAAAQILFLDVPDHASVSLAVTQAAMEERNVHNARGVANSVLRRLTRAREDILARPGAARLDAPAWLFARWSGAYGEETAAAIAAAHLVEPGLDLSVKDHPETWAERLGGTLLPTGTIRLAGSHRVSALPGYEEGVWWVQDAAAALPARLLGDVAGKRVADLCAAPGGKCAELAAAGAEVTALDVSEGRLKRLAANLQRLGLEAELVAADVLTWKPGRTFDAVLLDAPCSATGTIRRHPDVAWLKRPEDIAALAELQAKMLDAAARLVAPGGTLVFCTCSLEPEEGEAQVAPFLTRHRKFALTPVRPEEVAGLTHLVTAEGALRTLPCHTFGPGPAARGMDGFFAVRFRRA